MNDEDTIITGGLSVSQLTEKVRAELQREGRPTSNPLSSKSRNISKIGTLQHVESLEHDLINETTTVLQSVLATYQDHIQHGQEWSETASQYRQHADEFLTAINTSYHLTCDVSTFRHVTDQLNTIAKDTYGKFMSSAHEDRFTDHIRGVQSIYVNKAGSILNEEQGF